MKRAAEGRRVIEHWMLAANASGEANRLDDLHLDQIDPSLKARECWVDAGFEAHRAGLELRTAHNLDLVVVLAFSLNAGETYPVSSRGALAEALDWSPPSLYLFRHGQEPWRQPGFDRIEQLEPTVFGCAPGAVMAFDAAFRQPDTQELCRTVYVAG